MRHCTVCFLLIYVHGPYYKKWTQRLHWAVAWVVLTAAQWDLVGLSGELARPEREGSLLLLFLTSQHRDVRPHLCSAWVQLTHWLLRGVRWPALDRQEGGAKELPSRFPV